MRKLLWLALLLPMFVNAQTAGTLQRLPDGTLRGSFGSQGVSLIPSVSINGTDGYILIYDSATKKYVPTPYTPVVPGLQDSLTKKANRTFDNVANGVIPIAKLASSTISGVNLGGNLANLSAGYGLSGTAYNGSTAQTHSVDSTIMANKTWVNGRLTSYAPSTAISGTTNFIPVFTGANSIGNSPMQTDGSSVGFGKVPGAFSGYSIEALDAIWTEGNLYVNGASTVDGLSSSGSLGVINLPSGTGGTDSILVHNNTTNAISRLDPNYYLTPSGSGASLTGVVHTTGAETVGGLKTFQDGLYSQDDATFQGNIINNANSYSSGGYNLLVKNLTTTNYEVLAAAPTWNQNTTGNAATATLAANSTLWNTFSITDAEATAGSEYFLSYKGSEATFKFATVAQTKTALGITGGPFLPASGGTLTGDLYVPSVQINGYDLSKSLYVGGDGRIDGTLTGTLATFTKNQNDFTYVSVENTDVSNSSSRSGFQTISGSVIGYLQAINTSGLYIGTGSAHSINFMINGATKYTIGTDGNNSWTGDGAFSGNISAANLSSGTYTPTLTNVANISGTPVVDGLATYVRIGNIVTVSFKTNLFFTSANVVTQLNFTLPDGMTQASNAAESGRINLATNGAGIAIRASSTLGQANFKPTVTADFCSISYTFEIL